MAVILKPPVTEVQVLKLKAGDQVLISGPVFTARDAAHQRMSGMIERGEKLPMDLSGQILYYVGPTPAQPGMATGSAGPTTSSRMDVYTPGLLAATGLKVMIGKGDRSEEVQRAIREHRAVYLAAVGGAGAFLAEKVKSTEAVAWPELGPEAVYRFEVEDFPATVVIDAHGGNLYRQGHDFSDKDNK